MDQITLGQIGLTLTFFAGIISAGGILYSWIKKRLDKLFEKQLEAFDLRIKTLEDRVEAVDMENCKNYLVSFLSDIDKGKHPDEIEMERFYEQYSHYESHGGNSYIKHKVEKLKKDGKL